MVISVCLVSPVDAWDVYIKFLGIKVLALTSFSIVSRQNFLINSTLDFFLINF